MNAQEITDGLATLGITGAELLKIGGGAFGLVLAAFFLGWQIGVAVAVVKKI